LRKASIPLLRSPDTGNALDLTAYETAGDRVIEGALSDRASGAWFRIEGAIADLSPLVLRDHKADAAFARKHSLPPPPGTDQKPDRNAIEQLAFFGNEFERYEKEVVESPFYHTLDRVTLGRWVSRTFPTPARIAEIGAGSGRQTQILAAGGHNIIAIDLSVEMLRVARKKLEARGLDAKVDFVVGIGEAPPLASGAFDAWVIMGSLHHFSDPATAVAKACALLKPGGKQYLLEPHKSPARPIFDWLMRRSQLWHEEANEDPLFTFEKFRAWLGAAGIDAKISTSTFLPPHVFYALKGGLGRAVLGGTDAVFGRIPGIQRFGGVIIAEGTKRA
jgi:SAM-dependent methyltransferase